MTKDEILSKFKEIQNQSGVSSSNLNVWIKRHHPSLYAEIAEKTKELDKFRTFKHGTQKLLDVSIFERIYCIEHSLTDRPICQTCKNKYVRFIKEKREYAKWCSISCSCKDESTIEKSKQTRLKRYGNQTFNNVNKAKQTRMSKNNGKWHSDDFQAKAKRTKLERYGNENYVNPDKGKQTKVVLYGSETYNNQEKCCATKLKRYGDAYYNNREQFKSTVASFSDYQKREIKEKRAATNVEKYGTEFATQADSVKQHTRQTCLERYGVNCALLTENAQSLQKKRCKELTWQRILTDKEYAPAFTYEEFISNPTENVWKWKCNRCGNVFEALYHDGGHHRCYTCYPNTTCGTSLAEQQLAEYVQTLTHSKVYNRCPENKHVIDNREIDIYIPDLKIGIEYDGLFYHQESNGKNNSYHLKKTEQCEARGVQLIHVFEDEWIEKQDIVKSRLRHLIMKEQKRRVFARKCQVHEISPSLKDMFLEKYHLQGKDASKIRLGLFWNRHLVAVMTFVSPRFNSNYEYELSRYATVSKFTIVGGAGKLLSYFEKKWQPKSLITYADRRWSRGNLYKELGFTLHHASRPNYFYVKNSRRFSRMMFQKSRQAKLLKTFDPNLSETQNMLNNGYGRIFDCGNLVFVKSY